MIKEKKPMKCPKCKYEWETRSVLKHITCPNCQRKFYKNGGKE